MFTTTERLVFPSRANGNTRSRTKTNTDQGLERFRQPKGTGSPRDPQLSAVPSAHGGSPQSTERQEAVSGLEEIVRKNSEYDESGLWSQANPGPIPGATTYLHTIPLGASVYLSAKWDESGYLGGVLKVKRVKAHR